LDKERHSTSPSKTFVKNSPLQNSQKIFSVLYAEDNAPDVLLFKTALKKADFTPDLQIVSDGSAALDFLKNSPSVPHLIILDLKMPKLNGLEVLAEIKKDLKLQHVLVIMFTNSDREEDKKKSLELKAYRYVQKPAQFPDLIEFARYLKQLVEKIPNRSV